MSPLKPGKRAGRTAVLLAASLLAAGCTQLRGHQGYILDAGLADAVTAGIDNKASVEKTLGRPTFTGQFNPDEWYYVARDTRQLAFAKPRATSQTVLKVRFDANGNVAAVERGGLDQIASISPEDDKTPTLGRNRSFFDEIFGNIGSVGAGGGPAGGAGP